MTLDLLEDRAILSKKDPAKIDLYKSFNPGKIESTEEIKDFTYDRPYSNSIKNPAFQI